MQEYQHEYCKYARAAMNACGSEGNWWEFHDHTPKLPEGTTSKARAPNADDLLAELNNL